MASERELDDLVALLPPLLRSLDALQTLARRLDPSNPAPLLAAIGEPEAPLAEVAGRLAAWPEALAPVRERLIAATEAAAAGLAELRT
ncbi:MAG: hypothetical protein ACREEW_12625, partial [Caulobacteraceae bacterium]